MSFIGWKDSNLRKPLPTLTNILPIVEGDGDVVAAPILLRKILSEDLGRYDVGVLKPRPTNGKGTMKKRIENFVKYAQLTPDCHAILILFDADTECALTQVAELTQRCGVLGSAIPIAIVCAVSEYESWFLASLDSLKFEGRTIIPDDATFLGSCEGVQDPKGWINEQLPAGRRYKETKDQASLTSCVDISQASANSRSFARLSHAVAELVSAIDAGTSTVTPVLL